MHARQCTEIGLRSFDLITISNFVLGLKSRAMVSEIKFVPTTHVWSLYSFGPLHCATYIINNRKDYKSLPYDPAEICIEEQSKRIWQDDRLSALKIAWFRQDVGPWICKLLAGVPGRSRSRHGEAICALFLQTHQVRRMACPMMDLLNFLFSWSLEAWVLIALTKEAPLWYLVNILIIVRKLKKRCQKQKAYALFKRQHDFWGPSVNL